MVGNVQNAVLKMRRREREKDQESLRLTGNGKKWGITPKLDCLTTYYSYNESNFTVESPGFLLPSLGILCTGQECLTSLHCVSNH